MPDFMKRETPWALDEIIMPADANRWEDGIGHATSVAEATEGRVEELEVIVPDLSGRVAGVEGELGDRLSEASLSTTFATQGQLSEVATGDPIAITDTAVAGAIQSGTASKATVEGLVAGQVPPLVADAIAADATARDAAVTAMADAATQTEALRTAYAATPANRWSRLRAAVANIGTEPLRWLAIGDSITEGTGVTEDKDSWPFIAAAQLRDSLQGTTVPDPQAWRPIRTSSNTLLTKWVTAGTVDNSTTFGFAQRSLQMYPGSTVTGTVTGTSIDVWYATGSVGGTFTVTVDGGTPVSVNGLGSTKAGNVVRVPLGASGAHTVVISAPTSGRAFIEGVAVFDGNETSGVQLYNAGRHGWTSGMWVSNDANTWITAVRALDPDLVTIMLGANDYTTVAGRAFTDNVTEMVRRIREAGDPSIVLIAPYKRQETATPAWEFYTQTMERMADDLRCGFVDLREQMPDVGSAAATGMYADSVHPTATGTARIGSLVAAAVLANG